MKNELLKPLLDKTCYMCGKNFSPLKGMTCSVLMENVNEYSETMQRAESLDLCFECAEKFTRVMQKLSALQSFGEGET